MFCSTLICQHEPILLSVFGDQPDPVPHGVARTADRTLLAVHEDRTGRLARPQPEYRLQQFRAAGSHQAENAEDFARIDRERHPSTRRNSEVADFCDRSLTRSRSPCGFASV